LNGQISWKNATGDDAEMLKNLQPNIIKPHTREYLTLLFLKFGDGQSGKTLLRDLASVMKSAKQHLDEIEAFKSSKKPGTPYVGVGITASGYGKLGIPNPPLDNSFQAGMQAASGLNDPSVATWDSHFRQKQDLHAVILVADMTMEAKSKMEDIVRLKISSAKGVSVIGSQDGLGQHNSNGDGIEHFGYVDGRSQPLFLVEDLEDERAATDGTTTWDPAFPLGQVIVPDLASDPKVHFGSYFIFRKLEQNVKLFKEQEEAFANLLGLEDEERSGAMLVGRFEDGTPVTLQSADGAHHPVLNNFNYFSDKAGGKCPFLGHIRKTNPRGSGGFQQTPSQEREHLMARRGQTYGVRTDNPNDGATENKPSTNVGLLFMAFNSDIAQQFEFTQITWANNPNFPQVMGGPQPGVDPLIGQVANDGPRPAMSCPVHWGDASSAKTVTATPRVVTMKGGEYFFMPSLAFLRAL
jgi:Dyp-type peroxidase family